MARYTEAVCKLCRREGQKLFLKGERCYTDKCALSRRAYAPGQHGQGPQKRLPSTVCSCAPSRWPAVFTACWRASSATITRLATKMPGKAGDNLLILLETRLDNVVYRCGWASSRAEPASWWCTATTP